MTSAEIAAMEARCREVSARCAFRKADLRRAAIPCALNVALSLIAGFIGFAPMFGFAAMFGLLLASMVRLSEDFEASEAEYAESAEWWGRQIGHEVVAP